MTRRELKQLIKEVIDEIGFPERDQRTSDTIEGFPRFIFLRYLRDVKGTESPDEYAEKVVRNITRIYYPEPFKEKQKAIPQILKDIIPERAECWLFAEYTFKEKFGKFPWKLWPQFSRSDLEKIINSEMTVIDIEKK